MFIKKNQIIMMNGEKHTKYDVNLDKGTTEWVGEKMANELISVDKRKKNICHYVFVKTYKNLEKLHSLASKHLHLI